MEKPDIRVIPPLGFYYHYKHDPTGEVTNYAYEVVGLVRETETEDFAVLYRPLYDTEWIGEAQFYTRPLESFVGMAMRDGVEVPRFSRIEDEAVNAVLQKEKNTRYGT